MHKYTTRAQKEYWLNTLLHRSTKSLRALKRTESTETWTHSGIESQTIHMYTVHTRVWLCVRVRLYVYAPGGRLYYDDFVCARV